LIIDQGEFLMSAVGIVS